MEKRGEHAFRRFRLTHLRKYYKEGFPKDLEHFWMGHKPQHVSDLYSALKDDVEFRQSWAEKIGLGFELPQPIPESKTAQLDAMDSKIAVGNDAQSAAH